MVRLASASLALLAFTGFVAAAPIRFSKRAFQLLDYADFQISDGVAGNAEAEAAAVFIAPFQGVDLASVSADDLEAVKTMREAAEDAETALFNPAIDAATGAEADALQNGKIKNKVLKLTGEVQALKIDIARGLAAGKDMSSSQDKLAEEQAKLTKNIATDLKAAGQASKGVTGGSASTGNNAAAAPAAPAAPTASAPAASAPSTDSSNGASVSFTLRDYADFQISDGVAGNAEAEAAAVFSTPFAGVDLATVPQDVLDAVKTMREAAEDAETELFNPAIDAASGADADALQAGKIKNKVLKLTGEVQALEIDIARGKAAGKDVSASEEKLEEERTKLTKNIATDRESAGQPSRGVA